MAKIKELPRSNVIIIGLYAGQTKPNSVEDYLNDFIQDLKVITNEGLHYNGKHYSFALPDAFICDAPARAFLKCTKGHSGYNSCERCTEHGICMDNKVVFPDLKAPLRTDAQFTDMIDEEHHHGVSPLQELDIEMVSSFLRDFSFLCLSLLTLRLLWWEMLKFVDAYCSLQLAQLVKRGHNKSKQRPLFAIHVVFHILFMVAHELCYPVPQLGDVVFSLALCN